MSQIDDVLIDLHLKIPSFTQSLFFIRTFVLQHPYWTNSGSIGFPNDIAVLTLDRPANTANEFIDTIPIATNPDDFYTDAECWISGWGRLEGNDKEEFWCFTSICSPSVLMTTIRYFQRWQTPISKRTIALFTIFLYYSHILNIVFTSAKEVLNSGLSKYYW